MEIQPGARAALVHSPSELIYDSDTIYTQGGFITPITIQMHVERDRIPQITDIRKIKSELRLVVGAARASDFIHGSGGKLYPGRATLLSLSEPARGPIATGSPRGLGGGAVADVVMLDVVEGVVAAVFLQGRSICKAVVVIAQVLLLVGQGIAQDIQHIPLVREELGLLAARHGGQFAGQEGAAGGELLSSLLWALARRGHRGHSGADGREPVIVGGRGRSPGRSTGSRKIEPGEKRLSVRCRARWRGRRGCGALGREAQDLLPDQIHGLVEVLQAHGFGALMGTADEIFNFPLMVV